MSEIDDIIKTLEEKNYLIEHLVCMHKATAELAYVLKVMQKTKVYMLVFPSEDECRAVLDWPSFRKTVEFL